MLSKKFFSAGKPVLTDGTMGIFAGISVTATFQFSNGASAASTSLGIGSTQPTAGFGPKTRGIFTFNSTVTTKSFSFAGATVASGASLTSSGASGSAAGNKTVGIVAASHTSNATTKYNYGPDTAVTGTSLLTTGNSGHNVAFGSATAGIFLTFNGTAQVPNKYTYSTDGVASTTVLAASASVGGSISNGVVAIACGSASGASSVKYTFASDTNASNIPLTIVSQTGCGTSVSGFLVGSSASQVVEYTYSGDVLTSGFSLANGSIQGSASNGTLGVNVY